jgi:hypothetical protein
MLGDARNGRVLRAEARGEDPQSLGDELARLLRGQGADEVLSSQPNDIR